LGLNANFIGTAEFFLEVAMMTSPQLTQMAIEFLAIGRIEFPKCRNLSFEAQ
jgi:hypothetical protein